MSYDTDAIRERVTLRQLLEMDGRQLVRKGGRWFCPCPFHEEKTASFCVTERTGLFICFGCGAGRKGSGIKGDIFGYWMATRGVDFATAAGALAALAGTGEIPDGARLPERKVVEDHRIYVAPALEGRDLEKWNEGVRHLRENEGLQAKLAEWRGLSRDTIDVMIEREVIGCPMYFQARRWAFPVHAIREDKSTLLVGWHVRYDAQDGSKPQWHYVPGAKDERPSIGAWPLVLGEPATAKTIFFFEGEWDALAGADVLGWGVDARTREAVIVGIRGGRNLRHVLELRWPDTAQAFLFPDGDETGSSWMEPQGLVGIVRARSRATHCYTFQGVKDFNDLHRLQGTGSREQWREFFRALYARGLKTRKKRKIKLPSTP